MYLFLISEKVSLYNKKSLKTKILKIKKKIVLIEKIDLFLSRFKIFIFYTDN